MSVVMGTAAGEAKRVRGEVVAGCTGDRLASRVPWSVVRGGHSQDTLMRKADLGLGPQHSPVLPPDPHPWLAPVRIGIPVVPVNPGSFFDRGQLEAGREWLPGKRRSYPAELLR